MIASILTSLFLLQGILNLQMFMIESFIFLQQSGRRKQSGRTTRALQIPLVRELANVALQGVASQSSTSYDALASRAIDGNTDGN